MSYSSQSRSNRAQLPIPNKGAFGGRNPSNPRDQKASQDVSDWASKKKEQLERAKQLREERKYGSSHLKSAGETQMTPSQANIRSSQGFGGNSSYSGPPGMQSLNVPGGGQGSYEQINHGQNYNEYLSEAKAAGRQSPMNYPPNGMQHQFS